MNIIIIVYSILVLLTFIVILKNYNLKAWSKISFFFLMLWSLTIIDKFTIKKIYQYYNDIGKFLMCCTGISFIIKLWIDSNEIINHNERKEARRYLIIGLIGIGLFIFSKFFLKYLL